MGLRRFPISDHDVRFLIVGGYALAAHGHPRSTKDLDVWVWTDPGNATRVIWIRTGNVTTTAIAELLPASTGRIEAFVASAEVSLLVLPLTLVGGGGEDRPSR